MFGEDWREAGALCLITCLDELVNGDRFDEPADLVASLINIAPALGVMLEAKLTYGNGKAEELPHSDRYQEL